MESKLVLSIIASVLKYGPQAVIKIADAMKSKEITTDDIKALFINDDPADYFE